ENPRSTSPGSIMPNYPWLLTQDIETNALAPRISALRKVGVPYPKGYEQKALADLNAQANETVKNLKMGSITSGSNKEIIALVAYLQRLGTDIKGLTPTPVPATPAPAVTPELPKPIE